MLKGIERPGQAGWSLQTMVVLQAYQADLLREIDTDKGLRQSQRALHSQRPVSPCHKSDGPCNQPFYGCFGGFAFAFFQAINRLLSDGSPSN